MSQQEQIVTTLREMILGGELAPGQRLLEVALSERLHVSRTPVRHAIRILEAEGLVSGSGVRECRVRRFSFEDLASAIEVRGALEGYAARRLAMKGLSEADRSRLEQCLRTGDALVEKGAREGLVSADAETFACMNTRFHDSIVAGSGVKALQHAVGLNNCLPFAGAGAVALKLDTPQARQRQFELIASAQRQHREIFQALAQGQAARAEVLMREHAHVSIENVRLVQAAQALAGDKAGVEHHGVATAEKHHYTAPRTARAPSSHI